MGFNTPPNSSDVETGFEGQFDSVDDDGEGAGAMRCE